MIESMHVVYSEDSQQIQVQADLYSEMAEAARECARLLDEAKKQLDAIDAKAHEEIQQAIDNGMAALVRSIDANVDDLGDH